MGLGWFSVPAYAQNRPVQVHEFYQKIKPEDYLFFKGDTLKGFDLQGNISRAKTMNCSSNELHLFMLHAEQAFIYGKYHLALKNNSTQTQAALNITAHDKYSGTGIKGATLKDIWQEKAKAMYSHQAMSTGCNNGDFSNVAAPFTNWTAAMGINNYQGPGTGSTFTTWGNYIYSAAQLNTQNTTPPPSGKPITLGENSGLNSCSWVTICTKGTDSCGGFPMVCPGFTASCRLGGNFSNLDPGIGGGFAGCGARGSYAYDASTGYDTSTNVGALVGGGAAGAHEFAAPGEIIEQAIPITSANDLLTINFAAVLNDGGHPSGEEPFVYFVVYDQSGNPISCLEYYQEAIAGSFPPGFTLGNSINWIQNTAGNGGGEYQTPCYYKPWSSVGFDMTPYIGTTVTFQAIAAGCWQGGHFAYCYFDLSCGQLQLPTVAPTCGSTTLTAPGGAASYKWSGPCISGSSTNQTVTATCSGTYTCTINLTNTPGCNFTIDTTITVTSNPTPTITSNPGTTICSGGSGTTLTATGAGPGGTYTWSTGVTASSITVNPASTTTYTVTAKTSPVSCTGTQTVTVTVNTTPTISTVTASPSTTICSGTTVTLKATGSPAGTVYTWATGTTPVVGASVTATPTTTTTYTVTPSNGTCVGTAQTITITVNPTPTLTASVAPSATICAGGSVKLTASPSGLASYSWTPTGSLTTTTYDTTTASPTVTTTYSVSATTAAGCSTASPATVKVTVNTTPTVNITALPSTSICSGTTDILTASGATTYLWSTGSTFSAISITPLTTTTYTVTGTNAAGCSGGSATKTITINVTTTPTVTVNPPSPGICPGDTVKLTASGATTYSWNTGQTTDTIMAHPASTTTYTVTGANGACTDQAVVTVNVGTIHVTATASSPSVCKGQPDTIKASGAATYLWNTGNTNSSFVITAAGNVTYSVKGTSGSGCSDSAKVSITVNPVSNISASSASATVCPGDTTKAYVTVTGAGTPPYTYNWNTIPVQTNDTARGIGAGTYTVSVTDANHCTSDTATVTITTKNISVSASAAPSATICAGSSTTLSASGATNYVWSTGATTSAIMVNPAVDSTYQVMGTTTGTCKDSATVSVIVIPLPTVSVTSSDTAICSGQSATLTASGASSYTWTPTTGLTPTSGSPVTATPSSNTTYSVIGKSAAGCYDTASILITVNATPTATVKVSGNDTVCKGSSVTLTASGGTSYVWSPGGATSSSIKVSPATSPTTYTVTAVSANGACKDNASQTVYLYPPFSVIMKSEDSICKGQSIIISATPVGGNSVPGYTYSWTPNIGTGPGPYIVSPTIATTYSCTVTDGCNDNATGSTYVLINPSPNAKFTAIPNPVQAGQYVAFVDSSTNATSWYWTFGDGNTSTSSFPYEQYLIAGNYVTTLWVTATDGCRDSLSDTIHVIETIFIPNVFTPNGDGQNDVFHVTMTDMKDYHIEIFNRWGERVFTTNSASTDWDGNSSAGVRESDGIYYYIIHATDYSSKDYTFDGYLQLIR